MLFFERRVNFGIYLYSTTKVDAFMSDFLLYHQLIKCILCTPLFENIFCRFCILIFVMPSQLYKNEIAFECCFKLTLVNFRAHLTITWDILFCKVIYSTSTTCYNTVSIHGIFIASFIYFT